MFDLPRGKPRPLLNTVPSYLYNISSVPKRVEVSNLSGHKQLKINLYSNHVGVLTACRIFVFPVK